MVATFQEKLEKLTRFDKIRLLKLLEMTQYSLLAFFIGLILGHTLDSVLPESDNKKTTSRIVSEVILNIFGIVLSVYYIKKSLVLFPFLLSGIKGYEPSKKNESYIGVTIVFGLIFNMTQIKLHKNIGILKNRITSSIFFHN